MRRALVVDDERLARVELRAMLAAHPEIQVIGEAAGVEEALTTIARDRPDLVFLDIQLGHETGFDLLARTEPTFEVIFVTAYDEHAIRAFEVNAADYLLKPVRADRLASALERLEAGPRSDGADAPRLELEDRLFVRAGTQWRFLQVAAIISIEARGDYTRLRTVDGAALLLGKALRIWERQLPERTFVRIHRSTIVNLDQVDRVEEWSGQTFHVYLRGVPEPYQMSRRYAARLKH